MLAYVLVRRGEYSAKEVAEYLGRDAATIGSLVSRYEPKMQNEPELGRGVDQLAQFV
jgi:DNA-directed RNA polymerase specialized sigma24 family protein